MYPRLFGSNTSYRIKVVRSKFQEDVISLFILLHFVLYLRTSFSLLREDHGVVVTPLPLFSTFLAKVEE